MTLYIFVTLTNFRFPLKFHMDIGTCRDIMQLTQGRKKKRRRRFRRAPMVCSFVRFHFEIHFALALLSQDAHVAMIIMAMVMDVRAYVRLLANISLLEVEVWHIQIKTHHAKSRASSWTALHSHTAIYLRHTVNCKRTWFSV